MGFECTKHALKLLNVFYLLVAIVLIGVASYAKGASIIENVGVIGGIIASGVFLLMVAVLGIVGACRHNQVMLFFYMITLFLLFVLQFCIAIACLAVNESQRHSFLGQAWNRSSDDILCLTQREFNCWGYDATLGAPVSEKQCKKTKGGLPACCSESGPTLPPTTIAPPKLDSSGFSGEGESSEIRTTVKVKRQSKSTSTGNCDQSTCKRCYLGLSMQIADGLRLVGLVGLFFSFTEIFGVWLTKEVRNHRSFTGVKKENVA
jgi:tetraspanin-13/31